MGGELDVASVPGSGSSFVVALPGPAPLEPDAVATVLARALAAEEVRLEEAAVLCALRDAGRTLPRPHVVSSATGVGADSAGETDFETAAGAASETATVPSLEARPVRLRAIDGVAARRVDPAPA
jgi:hypothetical protein